VDRHRFKGRIPYHQLKARIKMEAAARPANYEVVEDASSGASVIQDLRNETALPIIPFQSVKDKVTRASVASPLVEAGKVFLPEGEPWVADFIDLMASFPEVEHDDEVDSFVMTLLQLSGKAIGGGAGMTVVSPEDELILDEKGNPIEP
jgi:predicted phage terminase large subunit-like protein